MALQNQAATKGLLNVLKIVRGGLDRRGDFVAAAHVEQARCQLLLDANQPLDPYDSFGSSEEVDAIS